MKCTGVRAGESRYREVGPGNFDEARTQARGHENGRTEGNEDVCPVVRGGNRSGPASEAAGHDRRAPAGAPGCALETSQAAAAIGSSLNPKAYSSSQVPQHPLFRSSVQDGSFKVRVPPDWGDRDSCGPSPTNGVTERACATLRPDYIVDNTVVMSEAGALGAGSCSPELQSVATIARAARHRPEGERLVHVVVPLLRRGPPLRHPACSGLLRVGQPAFVDRVPDAQRTQRRPTDAVCKDLCRWDPDGIGSADKEVTECSNGGHRNE